ncbi:MAG TPA: TetR/AcrR family transcriptional regulator, partial [Burkholderiaceae bacterium]
SQADDAAGRALIVDKFLSAPSVKEVGLGCPSVSLAADVAREPAAAPIRSAYVAGLDALVDILAGVEDGPDEAARRRAAIADYATMAGALMLARATEGTPLSAEFLAGARERLLRAPAPTSAPATAPAPAPARERATPRNTRKA